MERLLSPFSEEQIHSLNGFQTESAFASWKCKNCHTTLTPTRNGFLCLSCNEIVRTWAWEWMLNWEWKSMSQFVDKFLNGDHSQFYSRFKKQIREQDDKC